MFCWLPGNMNVDLTVSAKNGSGESQPSEPTSATVPQAVTKFRPRDRPLKTKPLFYALRKIVRQTTRLRVN